jgi:pentose-5-phosphate-3-epimerase
VGGAVRIVLDGGIDAGNAARFVAAGLDDLVVGRALCDRRDWRAAVGELRSAIAEGLAARARGDGWES